MRIHIVTLNVEGNQVGAWATAHADKADALAAKIEAFYGGAEDYFVGVYVAAVILEADIDTGPTNAIGIPLIDRSTQQSLF
jgi:hypothetical protein